MRMCEKASGPPYTGTEAASRSGPGRGFQTKIYTRGRISERVHREPAEEPEAYLRQVVPSQPAGQQGEEPRNPQSAAARRPARRHARPPTTHAPPAKAERRAQTPRAPRRPPPETRPRGPRAPPAYLAESDPPSPVRPHPQSGNATTRQGPHAPSLSGPAVGPLTTVPGRVPPAP